VPRAGHVDLRPALLRPPAAPQLLLGEAFQCSMAAPVNDQPVSIEMQHRVQPGKLGGDP